MEHLDAQRALAEVASYIKNAEEEMDRKIVREDQLYYVDNQVEALDFFLADTEDIQAGNPDLAAARSKLRALKVQLEKKGIEFMTQQAGETLPDELPPEEQAAEFIGYAKDFVKMADASLKEKVKGIDDLETWEEPLRTIKSFLADSEPLATDKELAKLRTDLKDRKAKIQAAIDEVLKKWRDADASGGDEEEDE